MAVDRRVLEVLAAQRRVLARITDERTRRTAMLWAIAWEDTAEQLAAITTAIETRGTATVAQAIRARKARDALVHIANALRAVAGQAGAEAATDMTRVVGLALSDASLLVRTQLPPQWAAELVRVDTGQVRAIVQRSAQQITARHVPLNARAQVELRRALIRGVALGENPRVQGRRAVAAVQGVFDGGLARAVMITRTETHDAYRTAMQAHDRANLDVLDGWQWIASLSARTCRSCVAHHGEKHPIDDPGPNDHHQGRCARVPLTKTYAELGFRGIPESTSAVEPGPRWLAKQPEATQRGVLGDKGYEAYRDGNYLPDSWSERRRVEGWRDSFGPAPVPA